MRKLVFVALLTLPLLIGAQAPEAPAVPETTPDAVETQVVNPLDAATECQSAVGGEQNMLQFALPFPIPYCGDYCDNPGYSRGCLSTSGGSPQKVQCTCIGNTWTCGTF